jgi:hypothetical protein
MIEFDDMIKRVWPPILATSLRVELDRVETHYGIGMGEEEILKSIGQ